MLNRKLKRKYKSVSEKVDEIILQDQNDEFSDGSSTELPGLVDYDEDNYELPNARSSEIRKRNIKMLSEQSKKYKGEITSRKDFEDELRGNDNGQYVSNNISDKDSSSISSSSSTEDNSNRSAIEEFEYDYKLEKVHGSDIFPATNKQTEKEKADCVQNQLKLWEGLLDLRIQSQNLVCKANLLPEPTVFQQTKSQDDAFSNLSNELELNLTKLVNYLITLQSALYGQFSEIKTSLKNSSQLLKNNNRSTLNSKAISQHLAQNFSEFKPYRNSVLLKWEDRTKLLTPGAKSQRKSAHEEYDIIRKIDNALINRRNQPIKKTQIRRHWPSENEETDITIAIKTNVYDDTDFYHHQLREFIECKTNSSIKEAEIAMQLKELQKLRQKMKKKVDTRASKGRKIRYSLHKKLINFMSPNDASLWTAESQNELYKSIFA